MTRNLKAIGFALMALFAMSAISASSASAHKFTSPAGYPQHLIGQDIGLEDEYTVAEDAIACHEDSYTGTLAGASTSIELEPEFGETCHTVPVDEWDVTITENACKLQLEWKQHHATDKDTVTVKVVCPVGQKIEIHHYANAENHANKISKCTDTITPQTATGTLNVTSETGTDPAKGDIDIHGKIEVAVQSHGACAFGFTLNLTGTLDYTTTLSAKSGARIHME